MLYKATLIVDIPGNNPDDAVKRLERRLPPGWNVEQLAIKPSLLGRVLRWIARLPLCDVQVIEIEVAPTQPAPITGTGEIKLPLTNASGR